MTNRFDVILIGTGLPMLLEGLALAQEGLSICFIDRADQIGGSWKCPEVLGFRGVEVGVHLIENRPNLNRLFRGLLSEASLDLRTPDFGLIGGLRLPMPVARILLYGGVAARHATKRRWEQVGHSLKNMGAAALNVWRPLIYPKGGIAAVLAHLQTQLENRSVVLKLGTEISAVEMTNDGVIARTQDGAFMADRLFMSSRAHAPVAGFEPLWNEQDQAVVTSAVLHLKSNGAEAFDGYVEVINDPKIKRVRNVTKFAEPAPEPGEALVTVQLRGGFEAATGDEIIHELKRLKLLSGDVSLHGLHRDAVRLGTLPSAALEELEAAFPEKLRVLRTVDLSDHRYRMLV